MPPAAEPAGAAPPLLHMQGISKSFPGVRALEGVDLRLRGRLSAPAKRACRQKRKNGTRRVYLAIAGFRVALAPEVGGSNP